MTTTTDKIRAYFRRFPNADVTKVAYKFNTAKARIYKLRKEVHEDLANAARKEENLEGLRRDKATLTLAQLQIAQKLGIDPYEYAMRLKEYDKAQEAADEAQAAIEGDAAINEVMSWTATSQGDNIVATLTERGTRYGKFKDHADVTQKLKFIIRQHMGGRYERMEPDQIESIEMICHKLGRIANGDPNYADSWVDIAGYAKLVSDRLEGVER